MSLVEYTSTDTPRKIDSDGRVTYTRIGEEPLWEVRFKGVGPDVVGYLYSDEAEQFDTTIYPTVEKAREALHAYADWLMGDY